ncbi:MAG: ATPase [Bacteroidetes bacterium GWA2_31_9b]|nr:MAG: ATPase [Bacteroidetes bacterium GWA2_31_9b]
MPDFIREYIKRPIYLELVKPYINKDIIKVLVGQRRVGKSYMLFQIMDELALIHENPEIIYINKELDVFESIVNHKDLLDYISSKEVGTGKKYIFIDEIQDIENFEKALRSLQAKGGYDIYCTGSNAKLLSGELATFLSGRYVEIKIYSLSFSEFLEFHKLRNDNDSLFKFFKYGGLPYLINLNLEDHVIYDYLKNIYAAILYKDIVKRYSIRNVNFLEDLVRYVADNTGSLVSSKKISDFLKSQRIQISPQLVLDYLSHLESAFFIFKVLRADITGKKIFEIGEKYYFEDIGLRNSIVGYKANDINKILENVVYQHLKISGYQISIGKTANKEIDFICEKSGKKIYVQVTYLLQDEKTVNREFGNLLEIKDNYPKYVVSMDEAMSGSDFKGIKQIHIKEFISKLR